MLPLICIDVDGTLIGSSGEPTKAVWAAAKAAVGRGQNLALCTARGAFGPTFGYAQRLDPNGWHVFHAGAAIVHTGTEEVRERPLRPEAVQEAVQYAQDQGLALEHYTARQYAVANSHPMAIRHAELLGVPFEPRDPADLTGDIVRVQFIVSTGQAQAVVQAAPSGVEATPATSPSMPGASFVTYVTAPTTKATAIADIATELGVDLANVMMVGDGPNDLAALGAVGHGVAMGNAEAQVKMAARHRVAHVDDDGLVEALNLSADL